MKGSVVKIHPQQMTRVPYYHLFLRAVGSALCLGWMEALCVYYISQDRKTNIVRSLHVIISHVWLAFFSYEGTPSGDDTLAPCII